MTALIYPVPTGTPGEYSHFGHTISTSGQEPSVVALVDGKPIGTYQTVRHARLVARTHVETLEGKSQAWGTVISGGS